MKVAELITLLQGVPQDHDVVLRGYEGGYLDANALRALTLLVNVNAEWYYGPHEEDGSDARNWHEVGEEHPTKKGILIT